jgi:prepilin-type N-terminal cleavage/methylation domain-containing protein
MNKGFTLLELIIVVIIVAVLAGLGIPQFLKTVERSKAAEGVTTLGALRSSQLRYYAEWNSYTSTCGSLDVGAPVTMKWFDSASITCAVANPLAKLSRLSGYTLNIDDMGVMKCVSAAGANGACPAGF